MKLSIITVVYNNETTISAAIESVLSQTYTNLEYIVIDGKSTDNTMTKVTQFSERIKKIVSEPDGGIYDAMNKGISLATGDIIGILNSDDIYADCNVLADVMTCFNNDQQLDILYGNLVYVNYSDTNIVVRKWISRPFFSNFFESGHVPPHPSLFVKANVYKAAGVFDTQYKLASDYEFMFRILKFNRFKSLYIDRLIVKMRLGGESNNSLKNIIKGNIEILRAWRNNNINPPFKLMPLKLIKRINQFF